MSDVPRLRLPTPEEAAINNRTVAVKDLSRTLEDGCHNIDIFPSVLLRVIRLRAWEEFLTPLGTVYRNSSMLEFITNRPPRGLGSSVAKFKQILGACENAEEALLEFDRAIRGEHGGAHNPHGLGGKSGKTADDIVNVDNVNVDNVNVDLNGGTVRPDGNSAQHGLRRLERAAEGGDGNAAEMLRRVLDPSDGMTVHGACVELGWRKPTKTIVDTPDGLSDAVVRRIGPLDTVKQAWKRANATQREEIAAWVDEQMSATHHIRLGSP
jgi:hypothetical protein